MELSTTLGPNRIKDSNIYKTTDPLNPVKIRLATDGPAATEPISIPGAFKNIVEMFENRAALASRIPPNGDWSYVTFKQYHDISLHIAKVFIKLGLDARNSVGILAFNCPEWFYANMGAIHANGISVGIYTTNSSDAVCHILENSRANIVVVDESKQMAKIREIKHRLPMLKAVIQIDEPFDESLKEEDGYYRWQRIMAMNVEQHTEELERRLQDIAINECCTLVYTSGTTGMPKGVMLSHDNLIWDSYNSGLCLANLALGDETVISFLPLSHVAAMNADMYLSLIWAQTVYFADRDALKGSLSKTMVKVRPSLFGAVPRVYEKIQEKLTAIESNAGFVKRFLLNWAKSCALEYRRNLMKGIDYESYQYRLAKMLVLNKIHYAMGLDRARNLCVGGAPMTLETKEFFLSLDLHLVDIYGLSENFGGHCFSSVRAPDLETVGKAIPGTETRIHDPDETGQGEICFRGRHVFMGYIDNHEGTNEALDDEGWLHTGDLGYMNDEGFVYVTGRLKELIITAGGENIPPVRIETLVKNELPILSNCLLVGDRRKYLTILVTLKTEMDPETGAPLNNLHPETLQWLSNLDLSYKTLTDILEPVPCSKVNEEIQKAISRANKNAISNAQKIQKFAILPHDFSIPTGELGPTLKVKRPLVMKKYADIIEGLYKD